MGRAALNLRQVGALAVAAPLCLWVAVTSLSCVSLYDLDDFGAAVNELCGVVAGCDAAFYPQCVARAGARLEGAATSERAAFLLAFTDTGCLETCNAAKSCFDLPPLCSAPASACAVSAQCCGFYKAGSDCAASTCCQPDGIACDTNSDCCQGECLAFEGGKTCGGIACEVLDASCAGSLNCCGELRCSLASQTCVHCEDLDGPCESGADCCSDYCNNAATGDPVGVCSNPDCGLLPGQPCTDAGACCHDNCVPVPRDGIAVCNDAACIPNGFGCDNDAACCTGNCIDDQCSEFPGCTLGFGDTCGASPECCEGVCDLIDAKCCLLEGGTCTDNLECCGGAKCRDNMSGSGTTCQGSSCSALYDDDCLNDAECCSQSCDPNLGTCCRTVDDTCSHGVCSTMGDRLAQECSDLAGNGGGPDMMFQKAWGEPGCLEALCSTVGYAYCCCDTWDAECRDQVQRTNVCNVNCTAVPG